MAIRGLVDPERRGGPDRAEILCRTLREEALVPIEGQFLLLHRDGAGEQVDLDLLALARLRPVVKRGEHGDHDVQRRVLVGDADAQRGRWIARAARQEHQAAQSLNQQILARALDVRPGLPVPGRGGVDDPPLLKVDDVVAPDGVERHHRRLAAAHERPEEIGNGRLGERSLNGEVVFGHLGSLSRAKRGIIGGTATNQRDRNLLQ